MRGKELPSKRKTASYFEVDGKPLGERNPKWLNDLYVRFTRLSQHLIERSGAGVHGFITNHSYIDNPHVSRDAVGTAVGVRLARGAGSTRQHEEEGNRARGRQ